MGNCQSIYDNEPFFLHEPPMTSGYTKKLLSGISNILPLAYINI